MFEETNTPKESRATIFLIEEDNNTRLMLTNNLRQLRYRMLVAADLEDAYEWVNADGHIHADLVLINLVGKTPEEALEAGRPFRDHAKYDGLTPLIVMAEEFPESYEGTNENMSRNDWICYFDGSDQLRTLLEHVVK